MLKFCRKLPKCDTKLHNEHMLLVKYPLAPNRKVSLSFEGLKPCNDFSLAIKVPGDILFQMKVALSTIRMCYLM